jgi:SAM-dependent methyltransferase
MSLARLLEQREIWRGKPVLEAIYEPWFERLLAEVPSGARVLEVGAGPGFFAAHARTRRPDLTWLASDIIPVSWNDFAADALRMPMAAESVDAIVGLDFIHHLGRPADFFSEAARVLRKGGLVTVVEPWVTPLSCLVYGLAHEEQFRPHVPPWEPFGPAGTAKEAFDGNNALVWALTRRPPEEWKALGFRPPQVRRLNSFAYLLSLGFSRRSLLPRRAVPALLALDQATPWLAAWVGLRAHLLWTRA